MDLVKERLSKIMADVFEMDLQDIPCDAAPGKLTQWDSLKHMILLMALEEEFELRFTDDEMTKCVDFVSILDVLILRDQSDE